MCNLVENPESDFVWCDGIAMSYTGSRTVVVIPSIAKFIANYTFESQCSITSVTIPYGVLCTGFDTFGGCTGLTSVIIPPSLRRIGAGTFRKCTGLSSIIVPPSVMYVGKAAFAGCSGLTSITVEGKSMKEAEELLENAEVHLDCKILIGENKHDI